MTLSAVKSLLKAIPEARTGTKPKPTDQPKLSSGNTAWKDSNSKPFDYKQAFGSRDNAVLTGQSVDFPEASCGDSLSMFDALDNENNAGSMEEDYEGWMKNKDENLQALLAEKSSDYAKQMSNLRLNGDMYGSKETTSKKYIGQVNIASAADGSSWVMEERGMTGTQKISSETDTILEELGKNTKYKKEEDSFFDKIREEVKASGISKGRSQSYSNGQRRYQYPYGQSDERVTNGIPPSELPQRKSKRERVFKNGRDYFDEEGQFLYRGPR